MGYKNFVDPENYKAPPGPVTFVQILVITDTRVTPISKGQLVDFNAAYDGRARVVDVPYLSNVAGQRGDVIILTRPPRDAKENDWLQKQVFSRKTLNGLIIGY